MQTRGSEGLLNSMGPAPAPLPSLGSWEAARQSLGGTGWWPWWEGNHITSPEWCPGAKGYWRSRVAGAPEDQVTHGGSEEPRLALGVQYGLAVTGQLCRPASLAADP